MCDCTQERDDKIVEKVVPETITIFSRCPTLILESTILNNTDWTPIDSVQFTSGHTGCDCTRKSSASTESSSESSGMYKLVCPTECACSEEEEVLQMPPVCLEAEKMKDIIEKRPDIECTLIIIKPEAVIHRKEIERRIYTEGFEIYRTRWLQLTPEQASEFYNDHFGELNFPYLVACISSGPIVVHVLAKQNAVEEWKRIAGSTTVSEARLYFPDSIRARYDRKGETFQNAVHSSDSREQAEKEIHFFFPDFIIEPLLRNEKAEDFLWDVINPILIEGLTLCCKFKPADPILWLANWLILNNPNKPKLPENLALIPA